MKGEGEYDCALEIHHGELNIKNYFSYWHEKKK